MDLYAMLHHVDDHILNNEPYGNYFSSNVYEEQVVCVGSHTEDQGYYTTETYVDYYYCECGAIK